MHPEVTLAESGGTIALLLLLHWVECKSLDKKLLFKRRKEPAIFLFLLFCSLEILIFLGFLACFVVYCYLDIPWAAHLGWQAVSILLLNRFKVLTPLLLI